MLKGSIINDIEDSNEVLLLNKKREKGDNSNSNEKSKQETEIEFKINQPLFKSEGIEFEKEIVDGFHYFLTGENEKFIDTFNRLETYKNSQTNLIKIEKEEEGYPEDSFVHLHDEELENEKEEFEKYKTNNEYYNKSENPKKRKLELHEGMENLNNKMKEELGNLKKFEDFEKSINNFKVRKSSENTYDIETVPLDKKEEEKIHKKEDKRRIMVLSLCKRCMGGMLNEQTLISQSEHVYLNYPHSTGSITDFHITISPKEHINSFAAVDETIYEEIRNYMKSIVALNLKNDMATVFIEYSQQASQMLHFEIECIPIKYKLLEDARMYFKKAFLDQDYEWTTNKNLVDTTPYKGNISKILNEKFSYVNVDFNAQGGFLHPIEQNARFSMNFLREIFCPLLNKTIPEIRYPNKLGMKDLIDVVEDYKKRFSYFDWTKYSS